jgi:hypothetical protein
MSKVTGSEPFVEDVPRPAPWPRGAVSPALPEERAFVVSVADFSRQAQSWAFFRRLSIGYVSALYVFGQGALSAAELL